MFLGKQSGVGEAEIVVFADYDVVKNADADDFQGFNQAVCAAAVFWEGAGSPDGWLCYVKSRVMWL